MAWLIAASFALLLSQTLISVQASVNDHNLVHDERPILQKSLVEKVNNHPRAMWKADLNPRFINATVGDFKRLLGSYLDDREGPVSVPRSHSGSLKLPKSFDAREAWPECISLKTILDQGHCGSCWAFAAVEALSDRFCVQYNESVILSVNDLLSCCGFECGFGCNGGFPLGAWQFFVRSGVVTQECNPYFDSVGCQHPGCEPLYETPECASQCLDNSTDWLGTKYYSSSAYRVGSDPDEIMAEVYTNGPIEVSFQVYEDFAHYKSGIYHHISGSYLGGHAVKLIGWGSTDEGVDYWILANSWNTEWGQDGYFYIQRGVNECGIESNAVAGMPASKQSLIASQ